MAKRILYALGTLATVALLTVAALLLFAPGDKPEPEPTPTATSTADIPEPTAPPTPLGEENQDAHGHDYECEPGEVGPSCGDDISTLSSADVQAAKKLEEKVETFAAAWVQVTPGESAEQRSRRLKAAGASDELAMQSTGFAREDSGKVGLKATAKASGKMTTTVIDRDETGLLFQSAFNVQVAFRLGTVNGGSGTDQSAYGALRIWVDESTGKVVKVVEDFELLRSL